MVLNIIKEQEARYNFASKIVTGNVLDVSYGRFMAYYGGKILLDKNAKEVWNYDYSDPKHVDIRKYFEGNMEFQNLNIDIFDKKFDSIILFASSYSTHNLSSSINIFSKLLNDNGVFIISIFNGELNSKNFSKIKNIEILTKSQSERILNNVFTNVTFYSQLLLSKKHILTSCLSYYSFTKKLVRSTIGNILLKFDKKSLFYKTCLLKILSKFDKSSEKYHEKLFHNEYDPIEFEKNHKPTYFIVICKK